MTLFTANDVKGALVSIHGNKALGPHGFGSQFYRDNWDRVGNDVVVVILDFFSHRKLLKDVNLILITLIPKVSV